MRRKIPFVGREPSRPEGSPLPEKILIGRRKATYVGGGLAWLAALTFLWVWWLSPDHVVGKTSFVVVSAVLAWSTLLPVYCLIVFYRSVRPVGPLHIPDGARVAMVVTKAPSEPFAVVAETLKCMLRQDYPHDTWLADEDPSAETLVWCKNHDVQVSSRKGREDYHRLTWPRRTRCKEGNLAFFYDHFGYNVYDFVCQLDADHTPSPGYLREMLRPFADPRVGYVSAPSICDKNVVTSWAARGRLYAEAPLHGVMQAGYAAGGASLCIGSHYAVRTSALREIGGLGPELAEDHSTTLMFNAAGWRGVHALDAIAHGDGPNTFTDLVTQEFQWSRSLVTILLKYTPHYLGKLSPNLKFQFLFAQLWYPLYALAMAVSFLLPIIALCFKVTFVNVTYPAFLLHVLPATVVLVAVSFQWRSFGVYRPADAKVQSWETVIFAFSRWPWMLFGSAMAVRDSLMGSYVDFRVTPKGAGAVRPLPARVLVPYAVLSVASASPAILASDVGQASGFYILAIVNSAIYAIVFAVVVIQHARENTVRYAGVVRKPITIGAIGLLFALPIAAARANGLEGVNSIAWGAKYFTLTQVTYAVAGAGHSGARTVTFHPGWTRAVDEWGTVVGRKGAFRDE
jgi:cellulose synthase (UDP-forming)